MENYGVKIGYLVCIGLFEAMTSAQPLQITYILFTLFVIPQAVAKNFATLIATRFIAGCCGGILQDIIDGISADVWRTAVERSLPITIYVFSLLSGVSLGPVIGGAVVNTLEWRWYVIQESDCRNSDLQQDILHRAHPLRCLLPVHRPCNERDAWPSHFKEES